MLGMSKTFSSTIGTPYLKRRKVHTTALVLLICLLGFAEPAIAARIKDIAAVSGYRANQLIGFGIVVGLNGTGDGTRVDITKQILSNMMRNLGVSVNPDDIKVKNTATVMATAELPPFAKAGTRIDVLVSSLGDAKSLQGGTLLVTPLRAANGEIYAVTQGALSIGGFAAQGAAASVQQNHPTVAMVASGATIEKNLPTEFQNKDTLLVNLQRPDFTTAFRVAEKINSCFGIQLAKPLDPSSVNVAVPQNYRNELVHLVYQIENLDVTPDVKACVVLNERTGTVVMGQNVRISTVAVAHGNLNIEIRETPQVSQPQPFAEKGETVVVPRSEVYVSEEQNKLLLLPEGVTIGEVVRALNAIGVSPRDLIAVLQAIQSAGALQAEIKII
jgi:flagellar P-ring protein precursor FlgI